MKAAARRVAHGAWRLLPTEFRRQAMSGVAARLVRPVGAAPAVSHGVIVAGDVAGPNGLAETARLFHASAARHGLARGLAPLGLPSVVPAVEAVDLPADAAVLAVVNAPILPVGLLRFPKGFVEGRRVIGVWAWELPVVPRTWRHGARFVHEVWAPSRFTAEAVEHLAPGRVRVVPYPVAAAPLDVEGDRATFGLPADKIVVLTVFNLASSMERKNPLGSIAAFKAAFGDRRDVLFILKLSGVADYLADLALIRQAIGGAANILLISETFSEARLRGLMGCADILLSLHRSEGFGLVPAVAMLLGKPVIATGWSGNVDFMADGNSALVSYKLIPVVDPRGTYGLPGALWAAADFDEAVGWLRLLAGDAGLRERMGRAARDFAASKLGEGPMLAALSASGVVI